MVVFALKCLVFMDIIWRFSFVAFYLDLFDMWCVFVIGFSAHSYSHDEFQYQVSRIMDVFDAKLECKEQW